MSLCRVVHIESFRFDPVIDHSLKNTVPLSTFSIQNREPCKDGLLIVDFSNRKKIGTTAKICHAKWKFEKGWNYMLSQTIGNLHGYHGFHQGTSELDLERIQYLQYLTCAHNLYHWSARSKTLVPFDKESYVYKAQNVEGAFVADFSELHVHPKYNGRPDCGFDIGWLLLLKETRKKRRRKELLPGYGKENLTHGEWDDALWFSLGLYYIRTGMIVEVACSSNEEERSHKPIKGKIKCITKTPVGGYLLWYESAVMPGAGACIMITDEKFVRWYTKTSGIKKLIVGLQTGHDATEGLNYATLITPKILKWICEV